MFDNSSSYKKLKLEQQQILDFAVLVCYSVPGLKKLMRGFKDNIPNFDKFHKPDYFKEEVNIGRLEDASKIYKENLSKYILLSAFSFFESYIKNVVEELIVFHGGKESFLNYASTRMNNFQNTKIADIESRKRTLQTNFKKSRRESYKKVQVELSTYSEFRFPSEYFALFGLQKLIEIVQGPNFRSALIPEILEIGFGIDLTEKINNHADIKEKNLKETFEIIRSWRNSIGHGTADSIGLGKVIDMIRCLRHLSLKTDNHLIANFFILERNT